MSIQSLRGVSLSWRVTKSQLVAKKRQLVAMLSSPTVDAKGRERQQNEHARSVAAHQPRGSQHVGFVHAPASNSGDGHWGYGHGYVNPTHDMMRTTAHWGQLQQQMLPPPATYGDWVPSRPPLMDMSARYLNGPPPRTAPAMPLEMVPPGGPPPHGYQAAYLPHREPQPPLEQQQHHGWYGSGYQNDGRAA